MNKTVFFKTFRRLFGFVLAISLSASVLTAQAQNARITLNLSDVPMSQVMKEIEKLRAGACYRMDDAEIAEIQNRAIALCQKIDTVSIACLLYTSDAADEL